MTLVNFKFGAIVFLMTFFTKLAFGEPHSIGYAKGYQIRGLDQNGNQCAVLVFALMTPENDYDKYEPYPTAFSPSSLDKEDIYVKRGLIHEVSHYSKILFNNRIYSIWNYDDKSLIFSQEGWSMKVFKSSFSSKKMNFKGRLEFDSKGYLTTVSEIHLKSVIGWSKVPSICNLNKSTTKRVMTALFKNGHGPVEYKFTKDSLFRYRR